MTLIAAARPQLRARAERDWSRAKAAKFLTVLGDTCNVAAACRASGVAATTAYRRRKSDAAFRAAWREAVASAYQRLELVLLERAFDGTEKIVRRKDGSEERMREYPNQLGLALLKMHRDVAEDVANEPTPEEVEELRARVVGKLKRLKKRLNRTAEA